MNKYKKLIFTAVGVAAIVYLIRNQDKLIKGLAPRVLDRIQRGQDVTSLTTALAEAGDKLQATLATRPDTEYNRRILSHMIGIERWGRRRLLVALGEPLILDEYDGYRPRRERTWEELKETFVQTRRDTVNVAHQLTQVHPQTRIPHNQLGDLTILDWLLYLRLHADGEVQKMAR